MLNNALIPQQKAHMVHHQNYELLRTEKTETGKQDF